MGTVLNLAIHPAETHPGVNLYGIASRQRSDAEKAVKTYKFQRAFGSYQELLDDPKVDFVYISTPNGLHFEWAIKALKAGKHVLLEKPFTSNADEARKLVEEAEKSGKVLMEVSGFLRGEVIHADVDIDNRRFTGSVILLRISGGASSILASMAT